ncbi:MAG: hypothetical protein WAN43_00060 [Rhodomicrobium sp.]
MIDHVDGKIRISPLRPADRRLALGVAEMSALYAILALYGVVAAMIIFLIANCGVTSREPVLILRH